VILVYGHIKNCEVAAYSAITYVNANVVTRPPKNPSQVFLGESIIKGVLPK